jgi:hypothetical protein
VVKATRSRLMRTQGHVALGTPARRHLKYSEGRDNNKEGSHRWTIRVSY